ncbi:N-acetylmuramoyl-L-alanine amidase [Fictibacillus aquaticus]|uniref:MurNAc-LAA domain-containing protein n=1 Tax=Fictibacillus aquaticus TaxID=2021314 RepID=A0A235FAW9_9BACL|nr:N-acetylmuramoyl-L-alanine amidase [Fictibacillus aquaticus]OYD58491.1 hypothetical protein CGZ90_00900 [Fictibacillus aquaticus]
MKLVVIINGGHGGRDKDGNPVTPGKRNPDGSLLEFDFNNPTAQYLGACLEQFENVETHFVYDQSGMTDTPLKTRTDRANEIYARNKGKEDVTVIYVSIHANADGKPGWTDANGIETYVYNMKLDEAVQLASHVQNSLIRETGRRNRGVKTKDLHETRETHMTAILVEAGFMTNKEECELLKSDAYRRKVAAAISEGVSQTYKLKKKEIKKEAATVKQDQTQIVSPFAKEAHAWVKETGISDGSRPQDPVTRQEVWVMLHNMKKGEK